MTDLLAQMNARSPKWARNPILAGYRGSHAHGTYIPPEDEHGTDDIDTFGVVVHSRDYYLGLDGYNRNHGTFTSAGDTLDIETHEIRKFVYLLSKGNPNVQQHLWLEPADYLVVTRAGQVLLDRRRDFLSQRTLTAFSGYAFAQLQRMTKGERKGYMGEKRAKLVEKYLYDLKNAAHCMRLLYGGIGLAKDETLQVRLTGDERQTVIDIKSGKWSLESVQELARTLFKEFDSLRGVSKLPRMPHRLSETLRDVIEAHWEDLDG